MKPTIKAIKHYVHFAVATTGSGAIGNHLIVSAVAEGAARGTPAIVYEGSKVNAIFVEFWGSGVTVDKTMTWALMKLPSGVARPTYAELINLSTYPNKKNVLKSGQGLAPTGGNIVPMIREWVHIPKGKQRMGLTDKVELVFAGTATTINTCGLSTYKEYE